MTWEQQLMAIKAISPDVSLGMRAPGDWYVWMPGVEIGGDGMLTSATGRGTTPEFAVTSTWQGLICLKPGLHVVMNAMKPTRRAVKWNGFMWADVPEKVTAQ